MPDIATLFLAICFMLCIAAIVSFSWSFAAPRWLLLFANVAAVLGALEIALTNQIDGLEAWAILFASGAFSCGTTAIRNLTSRPIRWVHRFAIYAGYAATFAAMAIAAICLDARNSSGLLAAGILIATYAAGSLCVFITKTLIVRSIMSRRLPEYIASLAEGPQQYT
jgi:hypothetical protein